MSDSNLPDSDKPKNYNTKNCKLNGFRNMVYKMARDRIDPIIIKEYVKRKGFSGTDGSIENFIKRVLKNNFGIKLHKYSYLKVIEVPGLITIKRNDLLKFITTKNDKVKKDKNIEKYISLIREKYPIINEIINVYNDFYNIFKEKKESLYDEFINKYELKEKVDKEILDKLDYDDTPPVDDEGNIIRFYDKSSDSNSKLHKKQAENRKKK